MIVISGALVLVALVLLVLGLTMTDLNFVYGSIAVSLISFVFLVIGILQRRGDQPATEGADGSPVREDSAEAVPAPAPGRTEGAGPVPVVGGTRGSVAVVHDDEQDQDVDDDDAEREAGYAPTGVTVLVVPGRPRYHVEGCRYLTGKVVEEIDVDEARDLYSPCGVCKPDLALAARAEQAAEVAEEPSAEYVEEDPYLEEEPYPEEEPADIFGDVPDEELASDDVDTGVPGTEEVVQQEPVPVAPRRAAARLSASAGSLPHKPPPKSARSGAARTTTPGTGRLAASAADPAPVAPGMPAVAPVVPAVVDAAPGAPTKAASRARKVVVIPDRGRFHTQDCRFVRDVLGTEELTRTQAARQGFQPCSVCRP